MVPRTDRQSLSLRGGLGRLGAQVALSLFLGFGGAILFTSTPSFAATTSTDSIIIASGSSQTVVPFPAGTPDVVTPLATAIYVLCTPFSGGTLAIGSVQACYTYQFGPAAGTVVVAGVQPSIGVLLPEGFTCGPPASGIAVQGSDWFVDLAPPETACS